MEPKPGEVTPMSEERLDAIERRNYAHQPIQPIDVDDLVKEITRLRSELQRGCIAPTGRLPLFIRSSRCPA